MPDDAPASVLAAKARSFFSSSRHILTITIPDMRATAPCSAFRQVGIGEQVRLEPHHNGCQQPYLKHSAVSLSDRSNGKHSDGICGLSDGVTAHRNASHMAEQAQGTLHDGGVYCNQVGKHRGTLTIRQVSGSLQRCEKLYCCAPGPDAAERSQKVCEVHDALSTPVHGPRSEPGMANAGAL